MPKADVMDFLAACQLQPLLISFPVGLTYNTLDCAGMAPQRKAVMSTATAIDKRRIDFDLRDSACSSRTVLLPFSGCPVYESKNAKTDQTVGGIADRSDDA
jgi:hypothetical protein